jgi:hypothetical protein
MADSLGTAASRQLRTHAAQRTTGVTRPYPPLLKRRALLSRGPKSAVFDGFVSWGCCRAFAGGNRCEESYDANPYASPYDHSAARILHSGQCAGAVPGISPAAQRGPRGPKTVDDRSRVGALLYVHSFVGGMGRSSAIRKWQSRVVSHFYPFVERVRAVSPRGSKGSRQCLREPPSSLVSSRRYSTLRRSNRRAISHMMSLQGHSRRRQPRPRVHSLPVCPESGSKFKVQRTVAKCQQATSAEKKGISGAGYAIPFKVKSKMTKLRSRRS